MTSIEYRCLPGPPDADVVEAVARINQEIFGFNETPEILTSLFSAQRNLLICLALQDGEAVGFKVGFEVSPRTFDSWRGAVLESARRQGIAEKLMALQHDWCRENGFRVVKTTTNSDNAPMLILNLKSGFEIVGTFFHRRTRLKVLQEKWLVS